jgi:hypothetical protein
LQHFVFFLRSMAEWSGWSCALSMIKDKTWI